MAQSVFLSALLSQQGNCGSSVRGMPDCVPKLEGNQYMGSGTCKSEASVCTTLSSSYNLLAGNVLELSKNIRFSPCKQTLYHCFSRYNMHRMPP
jgi:hypothetical protein